MLDAMIRLPECVFHNDIVGKAFVCMSDGHFLVRTRQILESLAKLVDARLDQWFQRDDFMFREEALEGTTADTMEIMMDRPECGIGVVELVHKCGIFVPTAMQAVDLFVELGIIDVYLIRADPNNGTVSSVQVLDLEEELAAFDDIVVGLVVHGEHCQRWAGD